MRVLVIPDVHQTDIGLNIAKKYIDSVDKVVFLGDYVDSFDSNALRGTENDGPHTLEKIFSFKKNNMDKVVLLCGNHDFSYIAVTRDGQNVSGHQSDYAKISEVIRGNKELLEAAVKIDDIVYSHAGISKQWYIQNGKPSIEKMNTWLHEVREEHFNWDGLFDGAGDEPMQTPFWIRPASLCIGSKYVGDKRFYNMHYSKQVVGHTELCENNEPFILNNKVKNFEIMPDDAELIILDSQERTCIKIFEDGKLSNWKADMN